MSVTRNQRLKTRKRKDRERRIRKQRNIQANLSPVRYRLDVCIDGKWATGVKEWRKMSRVEAHHEETEQLRKEGHEIVEGRVVDLVNGEVVLKIEPSKPKMDMSAVKDLPEKKAEVPADSEKAIAT